MTLAALEQLVEGLAHDPDQGPTPADRDAAIELARLRYSSDRPRRLAEDLVSVDGRQVPWPASFETGFSRLIDLEVPPGEAPPRMIERGGWGVFPGVAGERVVLLSTVQPGAMVRVHFTASHRTNPTAFTLPDKDLEAVAAWAAAHLLDRLAAAFTGDRESTIRSDSVDHQAKGRDYAARAAALRRHYLDLLGLDPKRNQAAGVVVDFDLDATDGGRFLTHAARRTEL
jgi:hypothetical protein